MSQAPLKGWHHTPDVPLEGSPLFTWPLRPTRTLASACTSWFFLPPPLFIVAIALISFYGFPPSLAPTQALPFGWRA